MRIALYARKSTEQEDRQIQSLDDQLRELGKLAERENLQIVETFVESRSAKTPGGRPEFERLVQGIEEERFEGVLCWSMDRLSRNPVDGGRIAYVLQTGKLSLIRTVERTYRPEDNALLLSIENGMATAYLQDLSRNVKRGIRGRVERGWCTSKAPIGYKNNPETREVDNDPARFDIVLGGWKMLLTGECSVSAVHRHFIAKRLTVPSRRGSVKLISRAGVHSLFKNPFYSGRLLVRGAVYQGKHSAMVSEEEFNRVREIVSRKSKPIKPIAGSFAFKDVFRCEQCGCACVGERRTKTYPRTGRTVEYVYYHCSGSKGCPKTAVRQDALEKPFQELAEALAIPRSFASWLEGATVEALERRAAGDLGPVADAESEIASERARLKALTEMRLNGELPMSEYLEYRSEIEKRIVLLEESRFSFTRSATRVHQRVKELLKCAADAGELAGGYGDPFALGAFARRCGSHFLNLGQPEIRLDPVLQKITTFEPLRNGSERPKGGDYVPSNSIWWSLVDDILNLARIADMQEFASFVQLKKESVLRKLATSLHRPHGALTKVSGGSLERKEFGL
ncbi:MAG: recombinase family protein [Armatimonadota bacterium]